MQSRKLCEKCGWSNTRARKPWFILRLVWRRKGYSCRRLGLKLNADVLSADPPAGPTCLVLDVRLPGRSGLDFQRELAAADIQLPIIFITGHGDIPMSVQAMKAGAIEFLTKPFRDQDLLEAIHIGLARDRARRENEQVLVALRQRFEALPPGNARS